MLFHEKPADEKKLKRAGSSRKQEGLGTQFKNSLASLVENINTTGVSYVRCIKPNLQFSCDIYDEIGVNHQLRCQGILEAIRIARAAYPNRIPHSDFIDRYGGTMRDTTLCTSAPAEVDAELTARPSLIPFLCTHFTSAVIEWRR